MGVGVGLVGVEVFFLYGVRDIFVVCDWVGRPLTFTALVPHCGNTTLRDVLSGSHLLSMRHTGKSFDINEDGLDRKRQWDQGWEALGLTVEPSISKSRAGEQKDEYYVNYPSGTLIGGKKFLEQHLKKGNDRSERFCLRIYFFWDRTANLVVVGWLPSHLDTRQTWRTPDLATWIIQAFKRSPAPATPPPAQALGSLRSPPSPHR